MKSSKDLKKVVQRLKTVQQKFQNLVKDKTWLEDARKYAENQGKEVKKLLTSDVTKVKTFLDKEKRELEKFQKQIPAEIEKFKVYVGAQKKELEKLLKNVKKTAEKKVGKKKTARKTKSAKRPPQAPMGTESVSPNPVPTSAPDYGSVGGSAE